ncbi:hypothetical protein FHG87_005842 [Trinorchestia longiramus]|nr:hypothetical protein FHG87_005842 [Trinorchestia longiramus]
MTKSLVPQQIMAFNKPNFQRPHHLSYGTRLSTGHCIKSKFFANDLAISKVLAGSDLGKEGVANIRKNIERKVLVVTMTEDYEGPLGAPL